jgi:hypothetical protein
VQWAKQAGTRWDVTDIAGPRVAIIAVGRPLSAQQRGTARCDRRTVIVVRRRQAASEQCIMRNRERLLTERPLPRALADALAQEDRRLLSAMDQARRKACVRQHAVLGAAMM